MIIRNAIDKDADHIAILLAQLGYPNDSAFVRRRLAILAERETAQVFVAEQDSIVVGFLSFDREPAFHRDGWIGAITAMCVLDTCRGQGIGKRLVEAAEELAKQRGCVRIAVASGVRRLETHKFYLACGYEEKTKRFVKELI
jgi:GNAT superfamily N-acetyltransferase